MRYLPSFIWGSPAVPPAPPVPLAPAPAPAPIVLVHLPARVPIAQEIAAAARARAIRRGYLLD